MGCGMGNRGAGLNKSKSSTVIGGYSVRGKQEENDMAENDE
jgi:hypothetical protein